MKLAALQQMMNAPADDVCFYDATDRRYRGDAQPITYGAARERGAAIAQELLDRGVERGSFVAVDVENCPRAVYLIYAAAYGSFTLVLLNKRLTNEEKRDRVREVCRIRHIDGMPYITEDAIDVPSRRSSQDEAASDDKAVSDANEADSAHIRADFDTFDADAPLAIMFTSGTSGHPKAAILSWGNLVGSAQASNKRLDSQGNGRWQLALPMYHVGGLQIAIRSMLTGCPFVLYRHFDAAQMLVDAQQYHITHVSVVDKMLQDLLDHEVLVHGGYDADRFDEQPDGEPDGRSGDETGDRSDDCLSDQSHKQSGDEFNKQSSDELDELDEPDEQSNDQSVRQPSIACYECILLGGAAPNRVTLERARRAHAQVITSYGMTETSSHIMTAPIDDSFDGSMRLLPGYKAVVVGADESGFGQLAVKGPGIIDGYVNANPVRTGDGFFVTGDTARLEGNRVEVAERVDDMFVSGGENVYPEEIRSKLLRIQGVTDAYVFGVPDAAWGHRPIAFVEMAHEADSPSFDALLSGDRVATDLVPHCSRLYMPEHVLAVPEFPRMGIGKTDRATLRRFYDERIEVSRVDVWRIRLGFAREMRNAHMRFKERTSLIIRVTDVQGRTGIGENVAFEDDQYLPETIDQDQDIIETHLIPRVLDHVLMHPSQARTLFGEDPTSETHPLAVAAVEHALWDLYGKIVHRSIVKLIGGRTQMSEEGALNPIPDGCVEGGVVIGIQSTSATIAAVSAAVDAGYRRVKLKVKPKHDVDVVRAVRTKFPHLKIMLDANQSYNEDSRSDMKALREMDTMRITCLEEPLDAHYTPKSGPRALFDRLARLQQSLATPVALDESWTNVAELHDALTRPELRCVVIKAAKFGGVQTFLDEYKCMRRRGISMWMGGMFDTGVSKRLHAALATLPGIIIPGDINDVESCFGTDVTVPPCVPHNGLLRVNPQGHEYGLGCELDRDAIEHHSIEHHVFSTSAD